MILLSKDSKICCLAISLEMGNRFNSFHETRIYYNLGNIENIAFQKIEIKTDSIFVGAFIKKNFNLEFKLNKQEYECFYSGTVKTKYLILKYYDSNI